MRQSRHWRLTIGLIGSLCGFGLLVSGQQSGDQARPVTNIPERLPSITVTASNLVEDIPVGPYKQPEWTTARRFPTTRVYLQQPPWGVGAEQWVKAQFPRGEAPNYLFQEEVEIGLPYRFQFDLYENWVSTDSGTIYHDDFAVELRWALADWGKSFLNPTLYGEWKFRESDQ